MTVRNFDIQNRSRRGKHDEAAVNGAGKARRDGLYPRVKLQVNAELREMIAGVRLDCAIEHIQDLGRSLRPIDSNCFNLFDELLCVENFRRSKMARAA